MNDRILVNCVHPAEVTFTWRTIPGIGLDFIKDVKVFAFLDVIAIYQQDGPGEVSLVYAAPATGEWAPMNPHAAHSMQQINYPTPDGIVIVRPGLGCGCGQMALKAFSSVQVDLGNGIALG